MKRLICKKDKNFFNKNGFLVINNFFHKAQMNRLKKSVSKLIKFKYDNNIEPDKVKFFENSKLKNPLQLCNVWKANSEFKKIALNKNLGKMATELTGWRGAKICQDSLYMVPSFHGGVGMHQDKSYQDWHSPGDIITCYVLISKINLNSSGIQYLTGSHVTKTNKPLKKFFNKNFKSSIRDNELKKFKTYKVSGKSGTIVFHHGNIWHGSDINKSIETRLTFSIHLMPSNSKFRQKVNHPQFSRYKLNNSLKMINSFFPTVFQKK